MKWTHDRIPDQSGRIAIVTGANTGLGYATARALAERGARVILACRSEEKGEAARDRILEALPEAQVAFRKLDLSDLDQVRTFAEGFHRDYGQLDLMINNAGVMMCPESKTAQGFETQFGVNHLGHFALTGLLLDLLLATPGSRVVNVSSMAHKWGEMVFDDLDWEARDYDRSKAYGLSKLSNLLFTSELQRRFAAAGSTSLAVAAHPGWTQTDLQRHAALFRWLNPLFAMNAEKGSLPQLRAATDPDVEGDDYYGPRGLMEMTGYPKRVGRTDRARNADDARRLWEISVERTGVDYEALGASA